MFQQEKKKALSASAGEKGTALLKTGTSILHQVLEQLSHHWGLC